jgi:cell division protein FtsI (penicillin-binding protein 3)
MKSRIVVLFSFVCIMWLGLAARGFFLQVMPQSKLDQQQKRQFGRTIQLQSRRGALLDRNGKELAVSVPAYSLFVDPQIISNHKQVAAKLARQLKLSHTVVLKRLRRKDTRFVWLARLLSSQQYEEIKSWNIRGLGFIEESKRVYPNNQLMSQVLGLVGKEGRGLEGLELAYEKYLRGHKKQVSLQKDARGRPLIMDGSPFSQQTDGSDIYLTIDSKMQFVLEQELMAALREFSAEGATGVILDAQTSEILALATVPSLDANNPRGATALRRNRVVTDNFEPGSTLKPFVVAGALRAGVIQPNTKFDCEGGRLQIGRRIIREADEHHNFDSLTVSEILTYSSNVGSTKIAFKLGADRYYQTLRDFGFGEKTGVELPGEARGLLHAPPWRPHRLSNISFGHGIAVTALQIANAYTVFANGGWLRQPTLVRKISNLEKGEHHEAVLPKGRRVLSAKEAETITFMLTTVTQEGGTGVLARVPGYPVAAKTGTAQKVSATGRGYEKGAYISSFAGYLPAHQPRFVIYVAVDNPQGKYYGSQVAAPIFGRLGHYLMRQTAEPPVLLSQKSVLPADPFSDASREAANSSLMPGIASGAQQALSKTIHQTIHKIEDVGSVRSFPTRLQVTPDLKGLTLREVIAQVAGQAIDLRVVGNESVVSKVSPLPGTPLGKNRKVVAEFR